MTRVSLCFQFIRELKEDKEIEALKYFQAVFVMIREGVGFIFLFSLFDLSHLFTFQEELSDDRVVNIQQSAFSHMQKFHRMRFKVPEVVARQRCVFTVGFIVLKHLTSFRSQRDATAQTFVTMASPQTMVTAPLQQKSFQREIEYRNGSQMKMVRGFSIYNFLCGIPIFAYFVELGFVKKHFNYCLVNYVFSGSTCLQ